MKLSLSLKFVITYIVLGIAGFVLLNTEGLHMLGNHIVTNESSRLYTSAVSLSSTKAIRSYQNTESLETAHEMLQAVADTEQVDIMIIDSQGQVMPRGQYGELVITTIGMEAQPLIRYRTGDYTRILDGECPCKSEVLRLDTIRRKTNDFLPDIWDLDNLLFAYENVVDYHVSCLGYGTFCPQAHAACRGLLNIRLLVLKECNTEVIRDKLTEKYRDWKVTVTSEKCKDTSSSLYFGKRSIKMQPISE